MSTEKADKSSTDNLVTLCESPSAIHALAHYNTFEPDELRQRIAAVREQLGDSLLILGHHYQQDEVIAHSDLRGDSYQLSEMAADSGHAYEVAVTFVQVPLERIYDLLGRGEAHALLARALPRALGGRVQVVVARDLRLHDGEKVCCAILSCCSSSNGVASSVRHSHHPTPRGAATTHPPWCFPVVSSSVRVGCS